MLCMIINIEKYIDHKEIRRFISKKNEIDDFYSKRIEINPNSSFGVSGNTYRVFKGLKKRPSDVFKKWAWSTINDKQFLGEISRLTTKSEFNDLHIKCANLLNDFWKLEQELELSFAHKNKLVDLFFKNIAKCDLNNEIINKNIIAYANIPIDSKTLFGLNKMFKGILLNDKKSMGVIKTKESYEYVQELVLCLSEKSHLPALYFDYFSFHINGSNNKKNLNENL